MTIGWPHVWTATLAAFLASLVEFVEALTVVLAVGTVRGWGSALAGSGAALAVLLCIVAALGSALARIDLHVVQLAVGALLLLFGMRWLRKAILRGAGILALHDEAATFARETQALRNLGVKPGRWDAIAVTTAFKITLLEGLEVVFIIVAVGAGGAGLLMPASLGALAALIVVALLGWAVHRPLASVPENAMKFAVGVLLSAFGTFWIAEGTGFVWPGGDWSIPGLIAGYLLVALASTAGCRLRAAGAAAARS
jgi:Ca2+/H+ antiporter, TMEM165/GDT1 family